MTQDKGNSIDPWLPSGLYTGNGEEYLGLDNPTGAAILRGKENWVARFSSQPSGQAVKEEVQALFC